MSDRTFAMPAYNASNLDPLNESDNESITSDRDLSELSDLARVVMAASYSPLRDTSRSDVSQPPPMRSVSPMMRDTSYLNRDTSYLSPSHPRPMSITGTHFDNACPSTNSSEVFNIDTEYRGRTLPYTNLATNYYSRVPSGSTDGRRSTSLLLEDRQPLTENDKDPYLVEWDGEYDRDCPLNWDKRRKWTVTIIVSCFTFLSPFASTMVTPALDIIGDEYDIDGGFNRALVMSIFLLGYAQGPFVLSSLSEIFGRVSVLQITNLVFLAFNTAAPFARNSTELYLFRFLSGIGGSAPQVVRCPPRFPFPISTKTRAYRQLAMQRRPSRHLAQRRTRQRPSHLRHPDLHRPGRRPHRRRLHRALPLLALDLLGHQHHVHHRAALGPSLPLRNLLPRPPRSKGRETTQEYGG